MVTDKDDLEMAEAYGLKPANESLSPRLRQALEGVRMYAKQEQEGSRDKLEIITDLMRGPNGATVDDVVEMTGWPIEIVRSTLSTLAGLVEGGQEFTIVNAGGTRKVYRITGWDEAATEV